MRLEGRFAPLYDPTGDDLGLLEQLLAEGPHSRPLFEA